MKAHIIENGVITNTINVDSLQSLPGITLVEATEGSIGYTYDGSNFIDPDPSRGDIIPQLVKDMRHERNALLAATDWTANSDVNMSEEMATYRQALRDLPETVDIYNPVYPELLIVS
jgi:hypothetical protein